MTKTLYYVFDPLCGWCYGASDVVQALRHTAGIQLQLLPSGLFSGVGARPMDDGFAAYAWSNDQRIERLTGQRFTNHYRDQVLSNHQQLFDSGPATLALTAVALTAPEQEAEALKAIQQARYLQGQDITQLATLTTILQNQGLTQAAARLAQADEALIAANRTRVANAQALMREVGARGVPTFILAARGRHQLLHTNAVYSDPQAFVAQLADA